MSGALATVLAHQGGWDEALFVAVPVAVLVALLWLAQRRAQQEERDDVEPAPARRRDHDEP